jgi:hypothetical protein
LFVGNLSISGTGFSGQFFKCCAELPLATDNEELENTSGTDGNSNKFDD